jgi:oligoendopeptidase F
VAEVPSTLSEALLLEHMLAESSDPRERIVLLQHAIDNITSTFYTQVMFADYELRAHRLVEQDQPITAEILNGLYLELLRDYYGDAVDIDPLASVTWARIPHFYNTPYYVYQYATCFASAAKLAKEIMSGDAAARQRYHDLLAAGGSDYPMALLKRAGVDLEQPETIRAVIEQLDGLVDRLEKELSR